MHFRGTECRGSLKKHTFRTGKSMYDYFAILQTLYYFVQYHMGVGEGKSGVVVMAGVLEGKEDW